MKDINAALKTCFEYKNSFSANFKQKDCPNLPFLLENLVNSNFNNPYSLYLEVTSMCNLRCKHCFFGYDENNYNANDDMTKDEIISLLDYMTNNYEICAVNIMGKEPFMRHDIIDIIKHIKQRNLYLRIQTNGTLITKDIFKTLTQVLDKQNDLLHISIDGAIDEIHNDIRGKGNFEKTKNIIKLFTENGYKVILAYTINAINVLTTPYLHELCTELGVKSVLLGLYENYIEPESSLFPDDYDVIYAISELIEKNRLNNKIYYDLAFLSPDFILNFNGGESILDDYLSNCQNVQSPYKCHKSERIAIMSNGDVYLCPSCQTSDKRFCLGNIRKQSFSEIWSNRSCNIFFKSRKFEQSLCKKCKYLCLCKGGCMAGSMFKYNSLDAPSAHCKYYNKLEASIGKSHLQII